MAVLKLLRNQNNYATRQEALNAIEAMAAQLADGEMWLSSYGEGAQTKTLIAVKRIQDDVNSVTVVDIEGTESAIADAINALDVQDAAADMHFVTSVSETDGKISVSRGEITSSGQTIILSERNDGGVDFNVNIDNETLRSAPNGMIYVDGKRHGENAIKIETDEHHNDYISLSINSNDKILAQDDNGLSATLTVVKETTNLEPNVQEQYKVVGLNNTQLGETIKIYKDSSLVNIQLGHVDDTLEDEDPDTHESPSSTIVPGSGDAALVYVVLLADGNYKLAAINVQAFLEENEFKDGLQVNDNHEVSVKVDENSESYLSVSADGIKVEGIDNIADAVEELNGIVDQNERIVAASLNDLHETKLDQSVFENEVATRKHIEGQNGDTYRPNSEANYINNATSLNNADVKLDAAIAEVEANMLSQAQLDAETAARKTVDGQNGDTYVANANTNYISNATSLNDADVKLDAAIKTLDNNILSSVQGSDAINVSAKSNKSQTVSLQLDSTSKHSSSSDPDNVLTIVEGNGLYLSSVIDAGSY